MTEQNFGSPLSVNIDVFREDYRFHYNFRYVKPKTPTYGSFINKLELSADNGLVVTPICNNTLASDLCIDHIALRLPLNNIPLFF